MRTILTISLPASTAKDVKRSIRDGGFASTSEFFRHLLRKWQEEKLLAELKASQREVNSGRAKILHSLKDIA